MDLATLSDEALFGKVEALAETERFSLADFLLHLAELDTRDACERKGYSSVFAYLTRHLGYAESDAIRRVRTARAVRKFPSILGMLSRGELHLVGVSMLQPFLTSENHRAQLGRARGKSQREIERMAAELSPALPEPRDRIRCIPAPIAGKPAETVASQAQAPAIFDATPLVPVLEPAPIEARRVFTFAAGEELHQLFLQARDLLRHKYPSGKMEDVFGEALKALVDLKLPKDRATRPRRNPDSRFIPESVRKPENLRILCRAHNQSEKRRLLGPAHAKYSS